MTKDEVLFPKSTLPYALERRILLLRKDFLIPAFFTQITCITCPGAIMVSCPYAQLPHLSAWFVGWLWHGT